MGSLGRKRGHHTPRLQVTEIPAVVRGTFGGSDSEIRGDQDRIEDRADLMDGIQVVIGIVVDDYGSIWGRGYGGHYRDLRL